MNSGFFTGKTLQDIRRVNLTRANIVFCYGGLLTENMVQAVARDVLLVALTKIEQEGIRTLFTVHDSIVCEVPEEQAQTAQRFLTRAMSESPEWANGLPLASETKSSFTLIT